MVKMLQAASLTPAFQSQRSQSSKTFLKTCMFFEWKIINSTEKF